MDFLTRANNIYVIDTNMFDFPHYQSCYIVEGKEVVLIDTGIPTQHETVVAGMKKHGFSIKDISRIILTHCEHPDHAGNAGQFIKENPHLKVYINPIGMEYLTNPEIEANKRKQLMLPQMAARFGEQVPIPRSNIEFLKDGEIIDIGNGETLRVMFTPAHQPSGMIIFEEKNNGLFINDIVGNCFADIDCTLILTPPRSDVIKAIEILNMLQSVKLSRLYLGHFGISEKPADIIQKSVAGISRLLEIADQCLKEGKPGEIESKILASRMPEVEKLKKRSQVLFEYTRDELITHHATYFAEFYMKHMQNK